MCSNLTNQVRSIAAVTTAVAKGDLTQKVEILVEGEMATLKETVNSMVAQLSTFASEVTRVALEVGTQGILGGQARVEGVQGTWADLTRNVNVSISVTLLEFSLIFHNNDTTHLLSSLWRAISLIKCDRFLRSQRPSRTVNLINLSTLMCRVRCWI